MEWRGQIQHPYQVKWETLVKWPYMIKEWLKEEICQKGIYIKDFSLIKVSATDIK